MTASSRETRSNYEDRMCRGWEPLSLDFDVSDEVHGERTKLVSHFHSCDLEALTRLYCMLGRGFQCRDWFLANTRLGVYCSALVAGDPEDERSEMRCKIAIILSIPTDEDFGYLDIRVEEALSLRYGLHLAIRRIKMRMVSHRFYFTFQLRFVHRAWEDNVNNELHEVLDILTKAIPILETPRQIITCCAFDVPLYDDLEVAFFRHENEADFVRMHAEHPLTLSLAYRILMLLAYNARHAHYATSDAKEMYKNVLGVLEANFAFADDARNSVRMELSYDNVHVWHRRKQDRERMDTLA